MAQKNIALVDWNKITDPETRKCIDSWSELERELASVTVALYRVLVKVSKKSGITMPKKTDLVIGILNSLWRLNNKKHSRLMNILETALSLERKGKITRNREV